MKRSLACALFLCLTIISARGQSTDVGFPTPVASDEVAGRIAPRDLGDARLTRHFYTFGGKEGDLVVTVESAGLDGAIDLFTAGTLRPLAKISLYAGTSSAKTSKSVYLRRDDSLILRVEARTAGDADGSYRVKFEGAFTPTTAVASAPEPAVTTPADSASARRDAGGRRTTATGARIPETEEEKATRLEAEERARREREALAAAEKERREALAAAEKERSDAAAAEKERVRLAREQRRAEEKERRESLRVGAAASRNARRDEAARAAASRRSVPVEAAPAKSPDSAAAARPEARDTGARDSSTPSRPGVARGRGAARTRPPSRPAATESAATGAAKAPAATTPATTGRTAAATEQPGRGARLIIETKNGARLVREMETVRRVTVENNQIVVVGRDGKVERQPMANVLRMSIEP